MARIVRVVAQQELSEDVAYAAASAMSLSVHVVTWLESLQSALVVCAVALQASQGASL